MIRKYSIAIFFAILINIVTYSAVYSYEVITTGANGSGNELHWTKEQMPVKYLLNAEGSADTPSALKAIRESFKSYSDIDGAYLEYSDGGTTTSSNGGAYDGMNILMWHETSWPSYYPASVIAVCTTWYNVDGDGSILDADIVFNGVDYKWSTTGATDAMDVQNIATHEIGHFSGLADLYSYFSDSEKTLYGYASNGETKKRTFDQDDEDGIRHIYPAGASSGDINAPETTISNAPAGTITDSNSVTFTFSGADDTTPGDNLIFAYRLYAHELAYSNYSKNTRVTYDSIPNGEYTFMVKAKDEAGNVDPTPAEAKFTIDVHLPDTEPPETTIDDPPDSVTHSNIVNVGFTAIDNQSNATMLTFSTYLEGYDSAYSDFEAVTSRRYLPLPDGTYTFYVKSKDEAGNVDPSPDSISFTVQFDGYENQTPTADAGVDQISQTGGQLFLSGFSSSDPENDALSYEWIQTGGANVTLINADTAHPYFIPFTTDTLTFELTVSDGLNSSEKDSVQLYLVNYILAKGSVTPELKVVELKTTTGDYTFDFSNADISATVDFAIGRSESSLPLTDGNFAIGKIFEMEPDGLAFGGDIVVTIPYDDEMLVGYPAENMRLYCYDSSAGGYKQKRIENIDTLNSRLTFRSASFTKYQLALTINPSSGDGSSGGGCYIAEAAYDGKSPLISRYLRYVANCFGFR